MTTPNFSANRKHDYRWYTHPDRPCKGKDEYADLTLIKVQTRSNTPCDKTVRHSQTAQIEAMRQACLTCPVLWECREDLLMATKDWNHYGIQAGIVGKT